MTLREILNHPSLYKYYAGLMRIFSNTKWQRIQACINGGLYYKLKEEDHNKIRTLLKDDYYVILTRRKCHLTTYVIALTSKLATGVSSHYTHALMNVEDDIDNHMDYKIIEATGEGVHWSTFMQVFDCDSVVLLQPRGIPRKVWTLAMETAKSEIGSEYDLLFDINDGSKVSCVEMVYQAIKTLPDYEKKFPNLIKLINTNRNELTPQMLYDCEDMNVIFEIKR